MFYLEKLEIKKYYLVSEPTTLYFNKDTNYLLGRNGTGKTTILEIIAAFFNLDFDSISSKKYETSLSAKFRGTEDKNLEISIFYDDKPPEIAEYPVELLLVGMEPISGLNKTTVIKITKDQIDVTINISESGTFLIINGKESSFKYKPSVFRALLEIRRYTSKNKKNMDNIFLSSILQDISNNLSLSRYPEGLEYEEFFFNKRHLILSVDNDIIIISNDAIINDKTFSIQKIKDEISTLVEDFRNTDEYKENIILSRDDSLVLETISKFISVNNIRLNYHVDDISLEDEFFNIDLGSVKVSIVLENGSVISYDKLSYGEKRMFHIINYLHESSVFLLDEPMNGFHHDFIAKTLETSNSMGKQSFIANQNPILFDYIEVENSEDFSTKMVFCKLTDGKITWTNPIPEESEKFMDDLNNQFLPVNMILKKLELW